MVKLSLITIALLSTLTPLFAQDCNNPLLAFFNLPALDSPISGADLPFCADLQATETCCSADTVATFQDKANAIINNLNNHAAGRDLYLAQLRNSYLDRFNDMLEDINDDHRNDLRAIREGNATLADELEAIINSARQLSNDSRVINNQFIANLDQYQRARSECFNTALEVQGSAWCLACNPNYAAEGVNADDTVTFSEGVCQAVSDACAPYFNHSAEFNPLFAVRAASWNLSSVARYLNNHTTNGVLNAFAIAQDTYNPLPSQQPVTVPEAWTGSGDATSPAQCQGLWVEDVKLASLLNIGADEGDVIVEEERSFPEENTEGELDINVEIIDNTGDDVDVEVVNVDVPARLLQDLIDVDAEGVWSPDLNGTGLDFGGLRVDPGDYFGASDYSDYFNQTQNASDLTDNDDDRTDNDWFDRFD